MTLPRVSISIIRQKPNLPLAVVAIPEAPLPFLPHRLVIQDVLTHNVDGHRVTQPGTYMHLHYARSLEFPISRHLRPSK